MYYLNDEANIKEVNMNIFIANNTLTVKLSEDIDHKNAVEIRKQIDEEINKRPIKKLIFDFSAVEFMDSAGIGMILGRYKTAKLVGSTLNLSNVKPAIKKVLEMSGVLKIIPIMEE